MSLFNKIKKTVNRTTNRAGGEAFTPSPKMQLASLLLTSFAQDQYYRSANATFKELIQLLAKVDAEFAAKAAIYARTKFGMRSITHVLAAELSAYASGQAWAKNFYNRIIKRPDDMLEIMAYFYAKGGKTLPNAMKKGFAKSFDRFDGYQLAKYRGERKAVKLIDVVNLVHPKATDRNAQALKALVGGELKSINTWEAKLTAAGQAAKTEQDKTKAKAAAWAQLIAENKLGYFALLRNLRNILEQAPHLTSDVCRLLKDERRIGKSLVLPFRYLTALDAVNGANVKNVYKGPVLRALNDALEIALSNVPTFDGRTLVVLDDSGSMTHGYSGRKSPIEIGSIFAAVLYKSNDADLMTFSDSARYVKPYLSNPAMSIANDLKKNARSAGTNFHAIFEKSNRAYDRIIILSDMQGWIGHYAPTSSFAKYKQRFQVNPYVYSFDLQGYGSLQFPEHNIFCLAGFSEKVFDLMKLLETDRRALIKAIEKIAL